MGRVQFKAGQIISNLREAEMLLGQGIEIGLVIRKPP